MKNFLRLKRIVENNDFFQKAADPTQSEDVFNHIYTHGNDEHKEALANNPAMHPSILFKLKDHPNTNIQKAVARNPNSDSETLFHSIFKNGHVNDVKNNPILGLNYLENPENLTAGPENALLRMFDNHALDIQKYGKEGDNPEILDLVSHYVDPETREHVSNNLNTAQSTIRKMVKDPSETVRSNIAAGYDIHPDDLMTLLKDKKHKVRHIALTNDRINPMHLDYVFGPDGTKSFTPFIKVEMLNNNGNINSNHLALASKDEDEDVRYAAANHPISQNSSIINHFVDDPDYKIRDMVASNRYTSVENLKKLLQDENKWVREMANRRLQKLASKK